MIRLVSLAAALLGSAVLLSPTALHAQQPAGYYTATPIAAPTEASLITRDTLWSCGGGVCVAKKAPDRAEVICERIAKGVGKLQSFSAGGEALEADALAKCNARAK
ncbi:MAG TPA: hypothetical protein VF404_01035 [Sphingomonas sp.]